MEWLADGRYVTQWVNRYDFLKRAQSIIYIRELTSDAQGGTGPGWTTTTSFKQRHLEYCIVQYGWYANTYPNSRIRVTGTGTASFEGSPF